MPPSGENPDRDAGDHGFDLRSPGPFASVPRRVVFGPSAFRLTPGDERVRYADVTGVDTFPVGDDLGGPAGDALGLGVVLCGALLRTAANALGRATGRRPSAPAALARRADELAAERPVTRVRVHTPDRTYELYADEAVAEDVLAELSARTSLG